MIWKGKQLATYRDDFDAFCKTETDDEAREFFRVAGGEHTATNIQYMIGYCEREAALRLWDKLERTRPDRSIHTPPPVVLTQQVSL